MAETILRAKVESRGLSQLVDVDSAGIIGYHEGESADSRMRSFAFQRGYHIDSISRPVKADDFYNFDLIIGMDAANLRDLEKRKPADATARICAAAHYNATSSDVPDPYYGGASGFTLVIDMLETICDTIIEKEIVSNI